MSVIVLRGGLLLMAAHAWLILTALIRSLIGLVAAQMVEGP